MHRAADTLTLREQGLRRSLHFGLYLTRTSLDQLWNSPSAGWIWTRLRFGFRAVSLKSHCVRTQSRVSLAHPRFPLFISDVGESVGNVTTQRTHLSLPFCPLISSPGAGAGSVWRSLVLCFRRLKKRSIRASWAVVFTDVGATWTKTPERLHTTLPIILSYMRGAVLSPVTDEWNQDL